jgi:hypothetical protein
VGENVSSIIEDREGNLWFGTWGDGICKYDDRIQTYPTPSPLLSATEDSYGTLWFQTHAEGVIQYDGRTFRNFTINYGEGGWIVLSGDSSLWFGGLGRMVRYDGKTFQPIRDVGWVNTHVQPILRDTGGNLWFKVEEAEGLSDTIKIGRYDGKDFYYFLEEGDPATKGYVRKAVEDTAGNIWFNTERNGVYRYNGITFTHLTRADGLAGNRISSIVEDAAGNLWFGIRDNGRPDPKVSGIGGVSVYDGVKFQTYSTKDGLAWDSVTSILKTRNGDLWLGTWHGGVSRYDGNRFHTFMTKHGLASNSVVDKIVEDRKRNLWFGTQGAGVSVYDGENFQTLTMEDGLISNTAFPILADRDGNIWFKHWVPGLTKYTPSKESRPSVKITQVIENKVHEAPRRIIKVKSTVSRIEFHFPIGGFSPTVGSLARGLKPPSFRRFPFSRRSRALNPPTFSRWSFSTRASV